MEETRHRGRERAAADSMRRQARALLAGRDAPVAAEEIARDVMGIRQGPAPLVARLVAELLEGQPGFARDGAAAWRFRPAPAAAAAPGAAAVAGLLAVETTVWTDPAGGEHLVAAAWREAGAGTPARVLRVRPPESVLRAAAASAAADLPPPDWDEEALAAAPSLGECLPPLLARLETALPCAYQPQRALRPILRAVQAEHGFASEFETLGLQRLARRLLPELAHRTLGELAAGLGLSRPRGPGVAARLEATAQSLDRLLALAAAAGRRDPADLLEFQFEEASDVDWNRLSFGRDWLASLPEEPGIYRMFDRAGDLLYVGKSRNLRARVGGYFRRARRRDERDERLLRHVWHMEVERCGSELAALLAEEREIRTREPLLNVQREVISRTTSRLREARLLVALPAPDPAERELFVFCGSRWLAAHRELREEAPAAGGAGGLRESLRAALAGGPPPARAEVETAAGALELARGWLALHASRVAAVDLAAVRDLDHALELARRACGDAAAPGEGVSYR